MQLLRIPGPLHLLFEAFSKSGLAVRDGNIKEKKNGFVFLTDGGHIDNLGIYELLRRRCRLIISVDAEADPDFSGASLVQVERFARIDLNVIIRMNWAPIGTRTLATSQEIRKKLLKAESGPHVAVGLIDYPPAASGMGEREKGVLVYIKASLSGDENDYVTAYKAAYPRFPHETTADQLFSEEQFEYVTDPRLVLMMRDAVAYRDIKAKTKAVTTKAQNAPPLPKQRQATPRNERLVKAVDSRFKGGKATMNDLAAYIHLHKL